MDRRQNRAAVERRFADNSKCARKRDARQRRTAAEGVGRYAAHSLRDRHARQVHAAHEGTVPDAFHRGSFNFRRYDRRRDRLVAAAYLARGRVEVDIAVRDGMGNVRVALFCQRCHGHERHDHEHGQQQTQYSFFHFSLLFVFLSYYI